MNLSRTLGSLALACLIATSLSAQSFEALVKKVRLGGAVRMTYVYDTASEPLQHTAGQFRFDLFRLNVHAEYGKWQLASDFRLYPEYSGGPMLKYGWMGYHASPNHFWQFGVVPVPFGVDGGTSNNFYMNLDYYLGLEDDSDIGIKYTYLTKGWQLSAAFYKNDELPGNTPASVSRYGYDLGGLYREENQFNLRAQHQWGSKLVHQLGISGMIGGVRHIETRERGMRYAGAVHYTARYEGWHLRTQLSYYDIHAYEYGVRVPQLEVSAFGGSHEIAARSYVATASLSYRLPVRGSFVDELLLYNDLSSVHKDYHDARSSIQNILGLRLTTGPVITYLDCMLTRAHPYVGATDHTSLGLGTNDRGWSGLVMVNIGYYF